MIFAIDFDGTMVVNKFPEVGPVNIDPETGDDPVDIVKELQFRGHKVIIWTSRCGRYLQDVMRFLDEHGIVPDAVNANAIPVCGFAVPKVFADVFIDDRSFPYFRGWGTVRKEFLDKEPEIKPLKVLNAEGVCDVR